MAHPLVREHFGARLKAERSEAWHAGHGRLYEHLQRSAKEYPGTLAEMAPLFQAMHHGCEAGRHEDVLVQVFFARIRRYWTGFSLKVLGAFGAELSALAGFFDSPFRKPVATLTQSEQGYILNEIAFVLRALGRLRKAVEPLQASLEHGVEQKDDEAAAVRANNLCQLHLALGQVGQAMAMGEACLRHADRSQEAVQRIISRTALAGALHQAGELTQAQARFEDAEAMQAKEGPHEPWLYSLQGANYCDLLLAKGRAAEVRERAAYALHVD